LWLLYGKDIEIILLNYYFKLIYFSCFVLLSFPLLFCFCFCFFCFLCLMVWIFFSILFGKYYILKFIFIFIYINFILLFFILYFSKIPFLSLILVFKKFHSLFFFYFNYNYFLNLNFWIFQYLLTCYMYCWKKFKKFN